MKKFGILCLGLVIVAIGILIIIKYIPMVFNHVPIRNSINDTTNNHNNPPPNTNIGEPPLARIDNPKEAKAECDLVISECKALLTDASVKKTTYIRSFGRDGYEAWRLSSGSDGENFESSITLYISNDNIRLVGYYTTDPGGDTADYISYYFRIDGTIAFIEEDYRILAGINRKTISKIYLNPQGLLFDRNMRFYNLFSDQPKLKVTDDTKDYPKILRSVKEVLEEFQVPNQGL